jgi:hypothetical protein
MMVYTYILKDIKKDLFKIGRTKDPVKRFRDTCYRGKIVPYYLMAEDRELELHTKFKDMRVVHPDDISGRTEYFKRGGTFTETAEWVDKKDPLPFLSPMVMMDDLERSGNLIYDSITVSFELSADAYGLYTLSLAILDMLDLKDDIKYILKVANKVAVSEALIDHIKKNYKIRVSFTVGTEVYIKGVKGIKVKIVKLKA